MTKKNKYLPSEDDIPSEFNLGKEKAKSMLDNIKKSREGEDGEDTTAVTIYKEPETTLPLNDDFELARGNISDLLDVSANAIKEYFKFAVSSESPRAMEVLANMIKDTVDMNKNLIDIHQQRERINSTKITNGAPITSEQPSGNTQNNIASQTNILCSPGDLVKMLQQEQEKAANALVQNKDNNTIDIEVQ